MTKAKSTATSSKAQPINKQTPPTKAAITNNFEEISKMNKPKPSANLDLQCSISTDGENESPNISNISQCVGLKEGEKIYEIRSATCPSVQCNSDHIDLTDQYDIGPLFDCYRDSGYVLIHDYLVPFAFFDRLFDALAPWQALFEYGVVLKPRQMVGESFWASLDAREQAVLPTCILILIEQGRVSLYFPELDKVDD